MDASLNILDPSSRAESKPSSKADSKTGVNGGFASVLSNSKDGQTSGEASAGRQPLKASQEKSSQQTNTDSEGNEVIAAANTSDTDGITPDESIAASLFGPQIVSTDSSGTGPGQSSLISNNQSSIIQEDVIPGNAATSLSAGAANTPAPTASPASQNARTPSNGLTVAQDRTSNLPLEIILDAQNGGRHLGQTKEAGSAENKSNSPLIPGNGQDGIHNTHDKSPAVAAPPGADPLLTGTSQSEQNLAPRGAPAFISQTAPDARAVNDETIPASTPSGLQASVAAATGQTNNPKVGTDSVLVSQVAGPSTPPKAAASIPAGPQAPHAQSTMRTASTPPPATPGTIGLPEPAVPTQPQQTAELSSAARPANAAIDGLTAQASGKPSKAGPTGAQGQTPGPNAQTTQAANAQQHHSTDLAIQPVRTDAAVEIMPTLDVDSAPEMLTTGALQERVHNNLPQTTLNLRLAPGQAPMIAPNDLALHIARQVQGGTTRFEIRIDPPEMGRIEVQLDMTSKKPVQAHLFVERSETLDLLQRDARQLERALQNLGIDVDSDSLSFSLRDGDAGTEGQSGEKSGGIQSAYQVDDNDNTQDIAIQTDVPIEAYGFQLAAKQGVNIQV